MRLCARLCSRTTRTFKPQLAQLSSLSPAPGLSHPGLLALRFSCAFDRSSEQSASVGRRASWRTFATRWTLDTLAASLGSPIRLQALSDRIYDDPSKRTTM